MPGDPVLETPFMSGSCASDWDEPILGSLKVGKTQQVQQ